MQPSEKRARSLVWEYQRVSYLVLRINCSLAYNIIEVSEHSHTQKHTHTRTHTNTQTHNAKLYAGKHYVNNSTLMEVMRLTQ